MKRNIIKTLAIVNLFTLVACKNEVKNKEVEGKTKKKPFPLLQK
ncbi:hypothetical protein [Flavobacterium oreochromis]|nr:hypothetical protein [Flavobacterium oreochromis]